MIVLDSGHNTKNPYDPGCTWGSCEEASLAHTIKNKIALKCYQMKVPYCIPCYEYDTRERYWQSLKHNPKYYLCLHINGSVSEEANGVEAIYNDKGRQFANDLVYDLHSFYGLTNRGCYHYTKNQRSPAMFDVADIPMVLLEMGFLSNPNDRNKLVIGSDTYADIIFFTIAKLMKINFTVFTTGSKIAEKKDKTIEIPAPVIQQNGRTYFPLRTLEVIDPDHLVGWLPNKKKAVLYKKCTNQ